VGALAGALGGVVDALPAIANRERADWVDPAALAVTGALVGAFLGGLWARVRTSTGLALAPRPACSPTPSERPRAALRETALRVTLVVGLVVGGMAAVDMARRLEGHREQAGPPVPRARLP
jgi:hypothetical protein